jgi:hypothetical protein
VRLLYCKLRLFVKGRVGLIFSGVGVLRPWRGILEGHGKLTARGIARGIWGEQGVASGFLGRGRAWCRCAAPNAAEFLFFSLGSCRRRVFSEFGVWNGFVVGFVCGSVRPGPSGLGPIAEEEGEDVGLFVEAAKAEGAFGGEFVGRHGSRVARAVGVVGSGSR